MDEGKRMERSFESASIWASKCDFLDIISSLCSFRTDYKVPPCNHFFCPLPWERVGQKVIVSWKLGCKFHSKGLLAILTRGEAEKNGETLGATFPSLHLNVWSCIGVPIVSGSTGQSPRIYVSHPPPSDVSASMDPPTPVVHDGSEVIGLCVQTSGYALVMMIVSVFCLNSTKFPGKSRLQFPLLIFQPFMHNWQQWSCYDFPATWTQLTTTIMFCKWLYCCSFHSVAFILGIWTCVGVSALCIIAGIIQMWVFLRFVAEIGILLSWASFNVLCSYICNPCHIFGPSKNAYLRTKISFCSWFETNSWSLPSSPKFCPI